MRANRPPKSSASAAAPPGAPLSATASMERGSAAPLPCAAPGRRKRERRGRVGKGWGRKRLRAGHLSVRPDEACGAHAPLVALLRAECRSSVASFSGGTTSVVPSKSLERSLAADGVSPQGGGVRVLRAADYGTSMPDGGVDDCLAAWEGIRRSVRPRRVRARLVHEVPRTGAWDVAGRGRAQLLLSVLMYETSALSC